MTARLRSGWPPAAGLFVLWLFIFASVVPWRQGTLYSGGLDPVVLGKAALSVGTFIAVALVKRRRELRVGGRSMAFVAAISVVGLIGALETTEASTDLVLAVRLLLVAITIVLLLRRWDPVTALSTLLAAAGTVAVVSAITGVVLPSAAGRLQGVVPPLQSNELAMMAALPLLGLVRLLAIGRGRAWHIPAALALGAILVGCDSRTALAALILGIVAILATAPRLSLPAVVALICAIPVCAAALTLTTSVAHFLTRGEPPAQTATLNSRTIAWDAVLALPTNSWEHWWGTGYSTTQIAVVGQYWQTQVLDSSWVSALAQVGVIGVALLGIWVVMTVVSAARSGSSRSLLLPLLAFLLSRSILESGLVESSTSFVVFFAIATMAEPSSRRSFAPAEIPSEQPARVGVGVG